MTLSVDFYYLVNKNSYATKVGLLLQLFDVRLLLFDEVQQLVWWLRVAYRKHRIGRVAAHYN